MRIEEEIDSAIIRGSLPIVKIDRTLMSEQKLILNSKYANNSLFFNNDFWPSFVSVQDIDGWARTAKLDYLYPIILWIYDSYDTRSKVIAYKIEESESLIALLSDTFHFEYILSDFSFDWLILFNHHDFVIATGDAEQWIVEAYNDKKVYHAYK